MDDTVRINKTKQTEKQEKGACIKRLLSDLLCINRHL
jgi:hypothetical protein